LKRLVDEKDPHGRGRECDDGDYDLISKNDYNKARNKRNNSSISTSVIACS
jgi:hypothetical protein